MGREVPYQPTSSGGKQRSNDVMAESQSVYLACRCMLGELKRSGSSLKAIHRLSMQPETASLCFALLSSESDFGAISSENPVALPDKKPEPPTDHRTSLLSFHQLPLPAKCVLVFENSHFRETSSPLNSAAACWRCYYMVLAPGHYYIPPTQFQTTT